MSSTSGKEQFMRQFDAIVGGVKQNKVKVSTRNIEISQSKGDSYMHETRCRLVDVHTHGQVQAGLHS